MKFFKGEFYLRDAWRWVNGQEVNLTFEISDFHSDLSFSPLALEPDFMLMYSFNDINDKKVINREIIKNVDDIIKIVNKLVQKYENIIF